MPCVQRSAPRPYEGKTELGSASGKRTVREEERAGAQEPIQHVTWNDRRGKKATSADGSYFRGTA